MLEAGKKLQERYQIEKQVGQGGMGSVYLATDERFHSTVAIKEALFADESYRKAFAREARLLNSLKHSALPKVTDHFAEDNGQYIVMEYIGGDDLFEMMRKSGRPFPIEDVLEWADQLLDALSYLHEQGIIHRDIKPQNLKLTPQGKIILLDFGLAKGNPTDANYQTAAQSIFGYSRNYASLEQIQGTGTDPRSDVYSLAATLYHLLTARVPADALTRVMMVLNENKDPLEPAGRFNPKISQEVSDALGNSLALKAASRPQDVDQVKADLFPGTTTRYTAAAGTEAAALETNDLLTQSTKLIGADRTGDRKTKQSEMKTEVLGAAASPDSVQTRLVNEGTQNIDRAADTSRGGIGSKLGLASAAGLITLIVGGVAGMVYFWPTGSVSPPVDATNNSVLSDKTVDTNSNMEEIFDPLDMDTPEKTPVPEQEKRVKLDPVKSKTELKPAPKGASASTKGTKTANSKSKIEQQMELDGVTFKDGVVETDTMRVTEKGVVIMKSPTPKRPLYPKNLPITREQFEKLTPRQKRRLRDAIERERRMRNQRRPPVKPTTDKPPPPH